MNYPESIAAQVGTPQGLDNYWLPFTPNRYFREHPKLIAGAEAMQGREQGVSRRAGAACGGDAPFDLPAPPR